MRGATCSMRRWKMPPRPISIHAPRAGGDECSAGQGAVDFLFQSTPPVRGATLRHTKRCAGRRHFNPRPPCGGRLATYWRSLPLPQHFNPRPPCGGRRHIRPEHDRITNFNPRPPCGGRPALATCTGYSYLDFNPRPPCGGRPSSAPARCFCRTDFNPRPPCGGRLWAFSMV